MTVCIAALCADEGKVEAGAAVVAADRVVNLGQLAAFEREIPSVAVVAGRIVVLAAGDSARSAPLIKALRHLSPDSPLIIEQVASGAGALYARLRQRQIEAEVLAPRGLTARCYRDTMPRMAPELAAAIDRRMLGCDVGVDLLLAGVDAGGAHLFRVRNPGGAASDLALVGFDAIGGGAPHALRALIGLGQSPRKGLRETIFAVYAAKRHAELATCVGRATDLLVVRSGGITALDAPALAHLEGLFRATQTPPCGALLAAIPLGGEA